VHLLQSRTEESIRWLEKARSANSASVFPHVWLASAYGLKGDLGRARSELAEARRLLGGTGYSSVATMKARSRAVPAIRDLYETTFYAGLRKAGLPED
jgi:hypothetical protein